MLDPCDRHGILQKRTPAFVACQVPIGIGVHGCGVNTPNAAAVAEATAGLAIEVHIPIGVIFVLAAQSLIVAAGLPSIRTLCWFVVFNIPVPIPIVQAVVAPVTTISPIRYSPSIPSAVNCRTLRKSNI